MSHKALLGLFIVSIAVNLLLAGLIGGYVVRADKVPQQPLAWAFKEVSPEIRQKVRPIIREHLREVGHARRDLRRRERELRRLIESESPTREQLELSLAAMRVTTSQYYETLHGVGIDVLLSLDASERVEAAPYLFRPPRVGRDLPGRGRDDARPRPKPPRPPLPNGSESE